MSTNIVFDGVTYTIPATNDVAWGTQVTNFLKALPAGILSRAGGSFHLTTADLDFGLSKGIASVYVKSKSSNIATTGFIRMAQGDAIGWRNEAGNANLLLQKDDNDFLTWNSIQLLDVSSSQSIINKTIDADLNTVSNIRNQNVASDAAIDYTKLNVQDGDIPWTKVSSTGQIKDADIASDAAISGSKIDGSFGNTKIITAGGVALGTTYQVVLKADPTENYEFYFPDTDGTTGQVLAKSSGGDLEWVYLPGLDLNNQHILVGNASNKPTNFDTSTLGDVLADEITGLTLKNDVVDVAEINLTAVLPLNEGGLLFDTVNPSPVSPSVGQMYWDQDNKTIAFKASNDSTMQIGNELWKYCKNNTGSIITNGSIVYINSAVTGYPTIALARADIAATAESTIGMATEDIAINGFGRITTFGLVRGLTTNVESDTSSGLAVADSTPIYLSAVQAGKWVKTAPLAPYHAIKIGMVENAGAGASGTIDIDVERGNHLSNLHDVRITGVADRDTLEYNNAAGYWQNIPDITQYTKEKTGFVDPKNISVSYDKSTRTVTLTHATGIYYLIKGKRFSLGTSWTSTAHTNTTGQRYLLWFNMSNTEEWITNTFPGFDYGVYIAFVNFGATIKYCLRECHGLMDHEAWSEFHKVVGTYRDTGGLVPAASWAANTYTTAAVTPDVDEALIYDEDLPTIITAFTAAEGYTRLHIDAGVAVFTTGSTLPFPNNGTDIQYNQNPTSGTALTAITTNARFVNVYGVFVPAASDSDSTKFRIVWMTGQQIYTTLAAAQGEDFRTLNLGDIQTQFSEFIPFIRVSYERQTGGGSGTTFNARIPTNGISYITGSRAGLTSLTGFTPTDHNTLTGRSDSDCHPASAITGTAVTLAGIEALSNKKITGGTADADHKIILPSNTTANLDSLASRTEGEIAFDSTTKQVKVYNGTNWVASSGDVAGPSSSVDNTIVRFDGTSGKIIQGYTSGAPTISDTGVIDPVGGFGTTTNGAASATTSGLVTTGPQTFAGAKTFSTNPTFSAMSTAGVVHNSATTGALTSSLIIDADVSGSAAIAGSKIVSASGSVSGVVTTTNQTFAGAKTFSSTLNVSAASSDAHLYVSCPAADTTKDAYLWLRNSDTGAGDGVSLMYDQSEDALRFLRIGDGATHASMNSSGSWTFGASGHTGNHVFYSDAVYLQKKANTTNGSLVFLDNNGSGRWYAGSATNGSSPSFLVQSAAGAGMYMGYNNTSWTSISDIRMKKNILNSNLGLDEVLRLRPVTFDYNTDKGDSSSRVGFIAQEVYTVIPHAVDYPDDPTKMLGVSQTEMIPVIVKAIQELAAKLDIEKARNDALEARLAALEAK